METKNNKKTIRTHLNLQALANNNSRFIINLVKTPLYTPHFRGLNYSHYCTPVSGFCLFHKFTNFIPPAFLSFANTLLHNVFLVYHIDLFYSTYKVGYLDWISQ